MHNYCSIKLVFAVLPSCPKLWSMGQHTVIHLTLEERQHLENLIHAGSAPARTQTKAHILLLTDRSQGQRRTA